MTERGIAMANVYLDDETMDKEYGPLASLVNLPDLHERVKEMLDFWTDMAMVTSRLSEAAARKTVPAPDPPPTVTKWRVVGMGSQFDHDKHVWALESIRYFQQMFPERRFRIEHIEVPADD